MSKTKRKTQKMLKTKLVWKTRVCVFRRLRVNGEVKFLQGAQKKDPFYILIPFHLLMEKNLK